MISLERLRELASNKERENKKFFKQLKTRNPKDLDSQVHQLHNDAFSKINCLDCAYCCEHLGPRIIEKDIKRIGKYLNIKKEEFIAQYLRIDEDGDYVFHSMPCPFLWENNHCSIYDVRPKACREYPHTDQRKIQKILNLTLKNAHTCPAVYEIIEGLKRRYL